MIKFGELTTEEKTVFSEEINKSSDKSYENQNMTLWPEDDTNSIEEYFKDTN